MASETDATTTLKKEDVTAIATAVAEALAKVKEDTGDDNMDKGAVSDDTNPGADGSQMDLDGDKVPADNKEAKKEMDHDDDKDKDEAKKKEMDHDDDKDKDKDESTGHGMPNMDEIGKTIEAAVSKAVNPERIEKLVDKRLYKHTETATVPVHGTQEGWNRIMADGRALSEKVRHAMSFRVDVTPKMVKEHLKTSQIGGDFSPIDSSGKSFYEAISWVGGANADNDAGQRIHDSGQIIVDPEGLQTTQIRDLLRYREIPVGATEWVFQVMSAKKAARMTEGSANPNQNNPITNVKLNTFPTIGGTETIKRSDFENSYTSILDAIAQSASIGSIHAEAEAVFRDEANRAGFTPTNWFDGNGDTVDDDDASTDIGTLSIETVGKVQTALKNRGYSGMGNEAFCLAVTPSQLNDLRNDSDIDRWMSYTDNGERRTEGIVPKIHGVEIYPMQAIGFQNSGANRKERAVGFVKGYSFLLGSKRNVEITLLDNPNRFSVDWSWSKRIDAGIYKPESIVRVSTSAPDT